MTDTEHTTPVLPPQVAEPDHQAVQATEAQRKQALANAIGREVGGGWHVESQSDYQAVLVRPGTKVNHILHLLLTIITLGLWAIVWIWLAVFKKREHHKVVQVDVFGNVTVTQR